MSLHKTKWKPVFTHHINFQTMGYLLGIAIAYTVMALLYNTLQTEYIPPFDDIHGYDPEEELYIHEPMYPPMQPPYYPPVLPPPSYPGAYRPAPTVYPPYYQGGYGAMQGYSAEY